MVAVTNASHNPRIRVKRPAAGHGGEKGKGGLGDEASNRICKRGGWGDLPGNPGVDAGGDATRIGNSSVFTEVPDVVHHMSQRLPGVERLRIGIQEKRIQVSEG